MPTPPVPAAVSDAALQAVSEGVLICGPQRNILSANAAFASITGYTQAEVLGKNPGFLQGPLTDPTATAALQAAAEQGVGFDGEILHYRKDGSPFWNQLSSCAVRAADGRVSHFIDITHDVTERVESAQVMLRYRAELSELTRQLLAQERATNRVLAQALHDRLGQTLAAIRLSYDALGQSLTGHMPEWAGERARAIGVMVNRAIEEVRETLVELRPLVLEEAGLSAALENEVRTRLAVAQPVSLRLVVAPEALEQRWPADVEYAAFMVAREALANALLHAGPATVLVRLAGAVGWLRLEVIDDGRGLTAEMAVGRPGHLGMVGMRERATAIGARLEVDAAKGGGSRVCLEWDAAP